MGIYVVRLNDKGILQAENLSRKFDDISFDIVISSPQMRAIQTARIINRPLTEGLMYLI